MNLYLIKQNYLFEPYTEADVDKVSKIPKGEVIFAEWSQGRNYRHHAKFFVLVKFIIDNLPEGFPNYDYHSTKEGVLSTVKLLTGYSEMIYNPNTDKFEEKPKSIRFDKMDQGTFSEFYDRAVDKMLSFYVSKMGQVAEDEFLAISR